MPTELNNLLRVNRELEEKLFYEPRKEDWHDNVIKSDELSAALTSLSGRIKEEVSDELSVLNLLPELDFTSTRPLCAVNKNALQVVEIIFNFLRGNTYFDKSFYSLLNGLQLAFTRLALEDISFLVSTKN